MITFETINEAGRKLAQTIEKEAIPFEGEAIVFVGALGICVRRIQSLVRDKAQDPAVVCVDVTGRYVIPVIGGHAGGANDLARQIARVTGGEAVVTTQSDLKGLWALDTLARRFGWGMDTLSRTEMNAAIAAFVNGQPTALVLEWDDEGTRFLTGTCPSHVKLFSDFAAYMDAVQSGEAYELLLMVSPFCHGPSSGMALQYYPRTFTLGIGCQRETPSGGASDIIHAVRSRGFAPESIRTVATIDKKAHEPLLSELLRQLPWAERTLFSPEELAAISVPHPSDRVQAEMGCPSVAEAAALRGAAEREEGQAVQSAPMHADSEPAEPKAGAANIEKAYLILEKQKGIFENSHFTFALACAKPRSGQGHIEIVGAGPGDPELVSVRGRRLLQAADLILYAGSLVPRELTECAKQGAVVRNSAGMTLEEQVELMKSFYDRGCLVVRLHTGDPSIYGAIDEQMALFDRYGMDYHITPGISSFLAAAAELRSQLTIPGRTQTIILTRGEGRTPMPPREQLSTLAAHGCTMCIFLSASIAGQVQDELLAGGYPPHTPVAVCYRLTWKDQRIFRCRLDELSHTVRAGGLTLTTMIVVGEAIGNREGKSCLYDAHFTHLFRNSK